MKTSSGSTRQQSKMQPNFDMETAPRDGTPVLICTGDQIVLAAWHPHQGGPGASSNMAQQPNWAIWANGSTLLDEGWDTGVGWFMAVEGEPKYWIPLPKIING